MKTASPLPVTALPNNQENLKNNLLKIYFPFQALQQNVFSVFLQWLLPTKPSLVNEAEMSLQCEKVPKC